MMATFVSSTSVNSVVSGAATKIRMKIARNCVWRKCTRRTYVKSVGSIGDSRRTKSKER